MGGNLFRQWTKPSKWYRNAYLIGGGQQQYNFDGDLTDRQAQGFAQIQTLGYWWLTAFYIHRFAVFDDRLTRGGPVVKRPGFSYWNVGIQSDSRKKVVANVQADYNVDQDGQAGTDFNLSLELRPRSNVSVSVGPSFTHGNTGIQYVGSYPDANATAFYGQRYVFGHLEQNQLAMDTRLAVTFSPALTLELYMQPLISAGNFSAYNEFAAPRSRRRLVYGRDIGTVTVTPDAGGGPVTITVDADGAGPDSSYSFTDPSFTFRSLRGNVVLRWEYHPGSTLFLVWTRSGSSSLTRGLIDFNADAGALFQGPSDNIFLVKVNYWLGF
jgi:hypothetical protein